MKNQLIPPPELGPPSMEHLSPEERIRVWAQMVDEGDRLVMAALREEVGPDGDVNAAMLRWLDRRADEHLRQLQAVVDARRRKQTDGK